MNRGSSLRASMWIAALIPAGLAVMSFWAALHPERPVRWGRRATHGAVMSTASKIAFGAMASWFALMVALSESEVYQQRYRGIAMKAFVGLFIVMMLSGLRDLLTQKADVVDG